MTSKKQNQKPKIKDLRGGALSAFANRLGLKRRWFGLEPDVLLRFRVQRRLKGYA